MIYLNREFPIRYRNGKKGFFLGRNELNGYGEFIPIPLEYKSPLRKNLMHHDITFEFSHGLWRVASKVDYENYLVLSSQGKGKGKIYFQRNDVFPSDLLAAGHYLNANGHPIREIAIRCREFSEILVINGKNQQIYIPHHGGLDVTAGRENEVKREDWVEFDEVF